MRAPTLPTSALEITDGKTTEVLRGHVITVDDMEVTILDREGQVQLVPNGHVYTRTICPETAQAPSSAVDVRGRPAEDSVLEWVAPTRRMAEADPRCLGRPLAHG
ncbi:MAG: hypothetical protein QOE51_4341 [Actinoplanes sp.]|nr:hypothetical protein [Actinoplanes sp.]